MRLVTEDVKRGRFLEGYGTSSSVGTDCPSQQQSGEKHSRRAQTWSTPGTARRYPDDDRKQLLVLALAVELELLFVAEALPRTVICPKISDKKIMNAISRQWPGMNTYTAQRWVGSSSPPCTAVSC